MGGGTTPARTESDKSRWEDGITAGMESGNRDEVLRQPQGGLPAQKMRKQRTGLCWSWRRREGPSGQRSRRVRTRRACSSAAGVLLHLLPLLHPPLLPPPQADTGRTPAGHCSVRRGLPQAAGRWGKGRPNDEGRRLHRIGRLDALGGVPTADGAASKAPQLGCSSGLGGVPPTREGVFIGYSPSAASLGAWPTEDAAAPRASQLHAFAAALSA